MARFDELVMGSANFQRQLKALSDELNHMAAVREKKGVSPTSLLDWGYEPGEWQGVAEKSMHLLHQALWSAAEPDKRTGRRIYTGTLSKVTMPLIGKHVESIDPNDNAANGPLARWNRGVLAALITSGRVDYAKVPRRGSVSLYINDPLRDYPDPSQWGGKYKPSKREIEDIERQAAKADEVASDVDVTVDMYSIPIPSDDTPEKMLEWALKVINSNGVLASRYDDAKQRLNEYRDKLAEAEARIEELEEELTKPDPPSYDEVRKLWASKGGKQA